MGCFVYGIMRLPAAVALLAASAGADTNINLYEGYNPARGCCAGTTVRVGYLGTSAAPYYGTDDGGQIVGLYPDLMDLLAAEMDFQIQDVVVPSTSDWAEVLRNGTCDVIFEFSTEEDGVSMARTPFVSYTFTGLTRKTNTRSGAWSIFDPFHWRLWLAVAATVVVGGVVAFAIAVAADGAPRTLSAGVESAATQLYHATALLLAGDDFEWLRGPGRAFRLGFLFFALVTSATYTANLAAFLTRPNVKVLGPQTMDDLATSVACVEYESLVAMLGSLVAGTISPDTHAADGVAYGYDELGARTAWCVDAVLGGDADIFISNDVGLHLVGLDHCEDLHPTAGIRLMMLHTHVFARDAALARNISSTIDALYSYASIYAVFDERFRRAESCGEAEVGETTQIKMGDMAGVRTSVPRPRRVSRAFDYAKPSRPVGLLHLRGDRGGVALVGGVRAAPPPRRPGRPRRAAGAARVAREARAAEPRVAAGAEEAAREGPAGRARVDGRGAPTRRGEARRDPGRADAARRGGHARRGGRRVAAGRVLRPRRRLLRGRRAVGVL